MTSRAATAQQLGRKTFLAISAECRDVHGKHQGQHHQARRDFLKIAAAGTAGPLVRPFPAWAAPAPRIAIVGGGIAGLNAALTLRDAGIPSIVYEAASRLGGRMHSDTTSWRNGLAGHR